MILSTMRRTAGFLAPALLAGAILAPVGALAGGVWKPIGESSIGGQAAPGLRGKPLVVRLHADWCAECQTTLPDFQRFVRAYRGRVNVVDFDVTDGRTAAAAAALAARLGLTAYYERVKTQPLTVGFINPNSGTVYAALRGNVDGNDLVAAEKRVERSLALR